MRKVTTINLNGRAYQLEEPAYEKLQTYLKRAEASLSDNPDKTEVMVDIEQAVADKCDRVLTNHKNVVSLEQMTTLLKQMGEVEGDSTEAAHVAPSQRSKRLFVIHDGAMFMGVCNGLAAYLGVQPNLVRLAFVLLTVFTSGIWIVVYLVLGLLLPRAETEAELAEAYGKPLTAQGIVERARERVPSAETMERVSRVVAKALRIMAKIISVVAAIGFGIVTFSWLWTLWQVVLGRLHLHDQLRIMNGWREWLVITAVYILAAVPLLLLARLTGRMAENRRQSRASTVSESSLAVLWGLGLVTLVALSTAYAGNVRDYVNGHKGYIDVGGSHICVDSAQCYPAQHSKYVVPASPDTPKPAAAPNLYNY
jgi:phage shock protein PspC (stress-responsive transcriptional regulator)